MLPASWTACRDLSLYTQSGALHSLVLYTQLYNRHATFFVIYTQLGTRHKALYSVHSSVLYAALYSKHSSCCAHTSTSTLYAHLSTSQAVLRRRFGVTENAMQCFASYITDRRHCIYRLVMQLTGRYLGSMEFLRVLSWDAVIYHLYHFCQRHYQIA